MSIFTRKDRTKPLPAPEGYEWQIRETFLKDVMSGRSVFALELWPVNQPKRKKGEFPFMSRWYGHFERENEILAASKDALASYQKTLENEAFKARIGVLEQTMPTKPPRRGSGISRPGER